jgi:hypothetical protein
MMLSYLVMSCGPDIMNEAQSKLSMQGRIDGRAARRLSQWQDVDSTRKCILVLR